MRRHRTSLSRLFRILVPVMVTIACVGCSVNPVTGRRELIFIPESQEISLGTEAVGEFEKEFGGRAPNNQLQDYVQDLGRKLAAVSDRRELPWEFALVNSSTPNAFALPGGKIFVTAGLFTSLGNERQLAAVLGHEIGHVCAKHNVKGMQRRMGVSALAELAAKVVSTEKAKAAKAVTAIVGNMAVLKYSRDDEYQADSLGIKYMEKAGYNPWGMVETLEFLLKLGGPGGGRFKEMFQTHPLTGERIRKARAEVTEGYAGYHSEADDSGAMRFKQMQGLMKSIP